MPVWCVSQQAVLRRKSRTFGFTATGEPDTQSYSPLDPRDGTLTITPMKDGPLEVAGPAEMRRW